MAAVAPERRRALCYRQGRLAPPVARSAGAVALAVLRATPRLPGAAATGDRIGALPSLEGLLMREFVVGHSSDVHVPSDYYTPDDDLGALRHVVWTAQAS